MTAVTLEHEGSFSIPTHSKINLPVSAQSLFLEGGITIIATLVRGDIYAGVIMSEVRRKVN